MSLKEFFEKYAESKYVLKGKLRLEFGYDEGYYIYVDDLQADDHTELAMFFENEFPEYYGDRGEVRITIERLSFPKRLQDDASFVPQVCNPT